MATAWWHPWDSSEVSVTKKMGTPKRASDLKYWLKEARKVIKEVPEQWATASTELNEDYIKVSWPDIGWLYIDRTTRKAV